MSSRLERRRFQSGATGRCAVLVRARRRLGVGIHLGLLVAVAAPAVSLPAQTTPPAATADERDRRAPVRTADGSFAVPATCAGQPIRSVVVVTRPPFADRLPRQLEWARTTVRAAHANTRDVVVRRFLLFREGEACREVQRSESERILRAQPYLVDARIGVFEDEADGVRLVVETRDDISLAFSPRLNSRAPMLRGLRLGELNLAGTATSVVFDWRDGLNYNDILGVRYTDHQFAGSRTILTIQGRRELYGQLLDLNIVRPYYTDLQRFAWLAQVGGTRGPQRFRRDSFPANGITVRREYAQLGALVRSGPMGGLRLFGASMTREKERTDEGLVLLGREGPLPDTILGPSISYRGQHVVRVNALLGVRNIRFVRVQGFDALVGAQDIRVGFQLGVVAGRSLPLLGATDRDYFLSTNFYAGVGGQKWFAGVQTITEARQDRVRRQWNNLLSSGRAAWYFRPAVRQTTVVQSEWALGRRMQTPYQLWLGDPEGGLLGHRRSEIGGARRAVLRAEQRLVIPTRFNVADVGLAGFAEAGRLWGDRSVPYSKDTPWRGAVGVSLLAATPPRSRRLWRVDFGYPVGSDPRRVFEVRVTNIDRSRVFWTDPRDVEAARERTAPTSLFTWP